MFSQSAIRKTGLSKQFDVSFQFDVPGEESKYIITGKLTLKTIDTNMYCVYAIL